MITVEEMREFLLENFNISNDEELEMELKELGGIKIGIFVDQR